MEFFMQVLQPLNLDEYCRDGFPKEISIPLGKLYFQEKKIKIEYCQKKFQAKIECCCQLVFLNEFY